MNKLRTVLLLMILLSSQFLLSDRDKVAYAQQTSLNDAVPAVVRILGCNVAGCNVGLGSGVLIHASGVVLTANHVTLADLNDPTSQLEDFLIEMTTSAQLPPQARYRARLIAFKPESDLALLRIYWDEIANQAIDVTTLQDLPTLPLANAETIMLGEEVHILGYPLAGGRAINYAQLVVGGFDEGGALIKVSTTLSEGNSGGPALVERNGRFEIAGIVLRRRGTLGEIGFIRRIDQLQEMIWLANAQRVWVDNIQVSTQGTGATASLQISAEIHALDMVNRHVYLLAYAFEATTYLPWRPSPTGLPKSATGQVVFSQAFVAQHVVETAQTITFALRSLGVDPQQLLFRLLLWDSEATQVLWQDVAWRHPPPDVAVALAPPTQTATPTTVVPPALPPPTPTDTPAPATATVTATPAPDLMATATSIEQMVSTSIAATQAALPTNTPTSNLAATTIAEAHMLEIAVAATLTALTTDTPTPTQTPTETQTPEPGQVRTNPVDDAVYVYVPAGMFFMGSDPQVDSLAMSDETPRHVVMVKDFWIMRTEVTNFQYSRCVKAGVCTAPYGQHWDDPAYAEHPVSGVGWAQATVYAKWVGGRLPTEAEWEKACRGTDGRIYPWGNTAPDEQRANWDNMVGQTMPVGSYPDGASPYGVLDMGGNVYEWTIDWYGNTYYEDSPPLNPAGPPAGTTHTLRGGAWVNPNRGVRCGRRHNSDPASWLDQVGLRVLSPGF